MYEDLLCMQRTGSNKLQFFSEIPYIINYKNIIKIKGQGKNSSILSDEFCEV